jgi:hypothetical protein
MSPSSSLALVCLLYSFLFFSQPWLPLKLAATKTQRNKKLTTYQEDSHHKVYKLSQISNHRSKKQYPNQPIQNDGWVPELGTFDNSHWQNSENPIEKLSQIRHSPS